jgi:tRNA wybutosine-synthesizing protein 2
MSREDLAAVVDKRRGDATLSALRAEGVYDDARRVVEYGDDAIAIPVTAVPVETDVREVVEQVDPQPRVQGLADLLRERGWTEAEVDRAPSSWAVVGSVVLARLGGCPRPGEVGEALLELHGEADTVLDRGDVTGAHREPDVTVVAGAGDTETVHVEHGTKYALDLAAVMFSPGNKAERARMGEVTGESEAVLDMFAGVGYFALPMARAGADVTAVERNPAAFRYLLENASLNEVTDRLEPYRGDCREVVPELPAGEADRVVMGYYDATAPGRELDDDGPDGGDGGPDGDDDGPDGGDGGPEGGDSGPDGGDGGPDGDDGDDSHPYLDAAFHAVAPGGVLHVHAAVPEAELWGRPERRVRAAAEDAGRDVEVLARRTVKSHSEGVDHVVLDVEVA